MNRYILICVVILSAGISSCGGGAGKGRNAVMEGIALASTLKLEIQDFHSSVKEFPKDEKSMNFPSLSNKYVSKVAVSTEGNMGVITATFNGAFKPIENTSLILKVREKSPNNYEWSCSGTMDKKYIPASCVQSF